MGTTIQGPAVQPATVSSTRHVSAQAAGEQETPREPYRLDASNGAKIGLAAAGGAVLGAGGAAALHGLARAAGNPSGGAVVGIIDFLTGAAKAPVGRVLAGAAITAAMGGAVAYMVTRERHEDAQDRRGDPLPDDLAGLPTDAAQRRSAITERIDALRSDRASRSGPSLPFAALGILPGVVAGVVGASMLGTRSITNLTPIQDVIARSVMATAGGVVVGAGVGLGAGHALDRHLQADLSPDARTRIARLEAEMQRLG